MDLTCVSGLCTCATADTYWVVSASTCSTKQNINLIIKKISLNFFLFRYKEPTRLEDKTAMWTLYASRIQILPAQTAIANVI